MQIKDSCIAANDIYGLIHGWEFQDAVVTMDSCIWPKLLYLVSDDGAFFKIMLSKMFLASSLRYVTSDSRN